MSKLPDPVRENKSFKNAENPAKETLVCVKMKIMMRIARNLYPADPRVLGGAVFESFDDSLFKVVRDGIKELQTG